MGGGLGSAGYQALFVHSYKGIDLVEQGKHVQHAAVLVFPIITGAT